MTTDRFGLKRTKENLSFYVFVSLVVLMVLLFLISFFPLVPNNDYKYSFLMSVETEKRLESDLLKRIHYKAFLFKNVKDLSKNSTIKKEMNMKNFSELIEQQNLTTKKRIIGYFSPKKISSAKNEFFNSKLGYFFKGVYLSF